MAAWKVWKRGFDAREKTTADYMDNVRRSPAVPGPSGALLSADMKSWAKTHDHLTKWWGEISLSTKRNQERTLHALNQIQSRLMDIEERLETLDRSFA